MCNEAARLRSLGEIAADFSELKIPLRFPEGLPNLGEAPSIRITDPAAIVRAATARAARGEALDSGGENGRTMAAGRDHPAPGDDHGTAAELVTRRWSWPGPTGKPVYNFRSEGRRFGNAGPGEPGFGRCLIPVDAFFEFTDPGTVADEAAGGGALALTLPLQGQRAPPAPPRGEGKRRKDKWRFAAADGGLLCVAGLWRAGVVPGAADESGRGSEAFTMLTCAPGPDIAPYHSRQIVLMPRDRWADWLGGVVAAGELIAPTPAGTLVATRVR